MERRKFIKYSSFASIGASLFPMSIVGNLASQNTSQFVQFAAANTQIRHGALNLPFAKTLKDEMPFDWLIDVQQNIFFKDGFQRNEAEDMNVMSIALKDGDHFEALQVNNQTNNLSAFWKSQYLEIETDQQYQTLAIQDDKYTFSLICLSENENFEFSCQPDHSYFVQVLNGEVENEDKLLNNESGLGLISKISMTQNFISNSESKLLIIGKIK